MTKSKLTLVRDPEAKEIAELFKFLTGKDSTAEDLREIEQILAENQPSNAKRRS
jgi:hypothetical protein